MIEITDIGNGDEEKLMGYEVIVQLNKTEQKGHENVFLRMMQGNSVGIESEFKYFLKSLKLRNLPAMDNYFTINEELFSYGKTSKQEWDLIWEPVLRKRYEPILTNEFGVFF
jgi:hypothetical protein